MKDYEKDKPLISIHVPKCGGTSFLSVLKAWFGKRLYVHYFDEKRGKMPEKKSLRSGLLKRKFKKGICIHGHFNKKRGFGIKDYYPEVDQFITILRHPLELALSNYFYIKKQGSYRYRDGEIIDGKNRFKDANDYLRIHRSFLLYHFPFDVTMENYVEILDRYFIYVGILEDLQTSVNMLARKLGFSSISIGRQNVSEHDEIATRKSKGIFIERHKLEFAIYNYIRRHYKDF